jgi:hypothetical protein
LVEICWESAPDATKTRNFELVHPIVLRIAGGENIWDGSEATAADRSVYLSNFGALPSTAEMVERAVKKAKLCQKTGKGERNVTAYGIAGGGVKEMCVDQIVPSSYSARINERRKDRQQRAEDAGREARCKKKYIEDLTRGPSCIRNTVDHALHLYKKVWEIRERIGRDEYDKRFTRTFEMLTSLDKQGSAARYSKRLADFEDALRKPHKKGTRKLETCVTHMAHMKGEFLF